MASLVLVLAILSSFRTTFHSAKCERVLLFRCKISRFFLVFRCCEPTRVLASAVKEERSRESFDSPSPPPARRPRALARFEGKEPQEASMRTGALPPTVENSIGRKSVLETKRRTF